MKYFTSILFFIILANLSYSQKVQDNNNAELYNNKIIKYHKLKNTGTVLAVSGTGLTILGAVLINKAEWEETTDQYGTTQVSTNDSSGALGVLSLVVGIPMGIAGSIIGTIGHNKEKFYKAKALDNISFDIITNSNQKGVKISYSF